MTILPIIVIGAYFFSLLLVWSKSHSMAAGWPIVFLNMNRRLVFMGITAFLAYGSIIGIAYFVSIWLALAALVFKFIVGRFSFHHYFKQTVAEQAEWEYQQMLKDRANAGVPLEQLDPMARLMRLSSPVVDFSLDESAMRQEAYRRARQTVQDRVTRG
jgi:hypothetical protein